jgi:hypothetical protein
MDASKFVEIVKKSVCETAIRDTLRNLEYPPGRRPPRDLLARSEWYKALDENQRSVVRDIVRSSVENAIFGFLSVLDGVRPIETTEERGSFELRFTKGGIEETISPSDTFLYELFR